MNVDIVETKSLKLSRTFLGREVEVVFDRPAGAKHPRFDWLYTQNYGYLPGVPAPDGEDLDAFYLGVSEPLEKATGKCIAILHRRNDDDDKLVVVPKEREDMTDDEIKELTWFQEQYFDTVIVRE